MARRLAGGEVLWYASRTRRSPRRGLWTPRQRVSISDWRGGCQDAAQAARTLEHLGGDAATRGHLDALLPSLLAALRRVPDPDLALNNLDRFAEAVLDRRFIFGYSATILRPASGPHHSGQLPVPQRPADPSAAALRVAARAGHDPAAEAAGRPGGRRDGRGAPPATLEQQWAALRRFKARRSCASACRISWGGRRSPASPRSCRTWRTWSWKRPIRSVDGDAGPAWPSADPGGERPPRESGFVILGLGKLGAGAEFQLRHRSIFVYERDGETAGVAAAMAAGLAS